MTEARAWVREYGPLIGGTYILGGALKFTLFAGTALCFGLVELFGPYITGLAVLMSLIHPVKPGVIFAIPGYALAVFIGGVYYRRRTRGERHE